MIATVANIIGGIGLFLLGMILMTDGLKAAAGSALQQILRRFTKSPIRGLLSGTGITALVQSSSATTVTTIGFVSAGLLTFPQALGVIFGANLGSTSTGWLVSILGLKLSIGTIALPLVGVGALLRLLGRGVWQHVGMALAGFGVLFVGIDVLQAGTAGFAEQFDLAAYGDDWFNRIVLVVIGLVMTVLMQSSSAAVATTLTALYTGAIGLEQAAALVIGQNLGTTVKAALVTIGATIPAKRTALGHILFNVITAAVALLILPFFTQIVAGIPVLSSGDEALVIAAFHTAFNLLGIALFLPFVHPFSRWIERLIPETHPELTRHLQDGIRDVPAVALDATRDTLAGVGREVLVAAAGRLEPKAQDLASYDADEVTAALEATRDYVGHISIDQSDESAINKRLRLLHALDHLDRLSRTLRQERPLYVLFDNPDTAQLIDDARSGVNTLQDVLSSDAPDKAVVDELRDCTTQLANYRKKHRQQLLAQTAAGRVNTDRALKQLSALRWIDRLAYHVWRFSHHLLRHDEVDESLYAEELDRLLDGMNGAPLEDKEAEETRKE